MRDLTEEEKLGIKVFLNPDSDEYEQAKQREYEKYYGKEKRGTNLTPKKKKRK